MVGVSWLWICCVVLWDMLVVWCWFLLWLFVCWLCWGWWCSVWLFLCLRSCFWIWSGLIWWRMLCRNLVKVGLWFLWFWLWRLFLLGLVVGCFMYCCWVGWWYLRWWLICNGLVGWVWFCIRYYGLCWVLVLFLLLLICCGNGWNICVVSVCFVKSFRMNIRIVRVICIWNLFGVRKVWILCWIWCWLMWKKLMWLLWIWCIMLWCWNGNVVVVVCWFVLLRVLMKLLCGFVNVCRNIRFCFGLIFFVFEWFMLLLRLV